MPYVSNPEKEQITFLIPKALHGRITQFSKLNNCSFSFAARVLLEKGLEADSIILKPIGSESNAKKA